MRIRLPILLFGFSVLTHIPGIANPLLDHHAWAQTLRASLSRNYFEGGMRFFQPQYDYSDVDIPSKAPQFPLYSYLVALIYLAFWPNDIWGRILSAIFAGLSAVYLHKLARQFLSERAAVAAAFVFCLLPIRIYFMRTFMPESMAIFCLVAGAYYAGLWAGSGRFWPFGLISSVLIALMSLLKLPYLILVSVPLIFLAVKGGTGFFRRRDFAFWACIVAACFIGWYAYASRFYYADASMAGQIQRESRLLQEWTGVEFWSTHFLSRFPELLTTYAGLFFFFAGWIALARGRQTFALAWFGATVVYIVFCGEYGRIHQYASLPFAPVNAVFIGAGIDKIWDAWKEDRRKKALLGLLVLSIPLHAALRIKHWYRLDDVWIFRARDIAAKVSSPEDLFFVDTLNQPLYLYHIRRKGFVGELETLGLPHLEKARASGAKFFLSPVKSGWADWRNMDEALGQKFKTIHRDSDFVIYDLREEGSS